FTSWVPWITRLPFGSTDITVAAMVSVICSWRVMAPVPLLFLLELVSIALAGLNALGKILPSVDSKPSRLVRPRFAPLVREVEVSFLVLALSLMLISTVRMSPGARARWSLKKVRAPVRHSELAVAGCGAGYC